MKRWVKIENVWLSRLMAVKRWVKLPAPGQFRGEGVWVENPYAELEWRDMRKHGYLPTHVGHEPPKE